MERILPDKSKLCRLCLTESVVYHSLLEEDRAIFLETLTSIKVYLLIFILPIMLLNFSRSKRKNHCQQMHA